MKKQKIIKRPTHLETQFLGMVYLICMLRQWMDQTLEKFCRPQDGSESRYKHREEQTQTLR